MEQEVRARHARRLPIGAELAGGGVSFRVWAPARNMVSVVVDGRGDYPLQPGPGGYFAGQVSGIGAGARYRFRLDGGDRLSPDPASRFQPEGPHGPSEVVDPDGYRWRDSGWPGIELPGQVLYELHVGTFTPEGSWAAAARKLPLLKEVGVTAIEMMPVADFPGRFGWGYDGVDLFAPTRLYGRPDELRGFIDEAHALGMGVLLDVVYNHLGPDGNYLPVFTPDYFTRRYRNEWGEAINFDGETSHGVREFCLANARYWIEEFHFDGLRLDATQTIHDASADHIVAAIAREARAAAGGRAILVIAESEPQDPDLIRAPASGGFGLDAIWNDDFHHSAMVAATGQRRAYYRDHQGAPHEFVSAAKYGVLFQGQHYVWQAKRRGKPGLDLSPAHFVNCLQNHDQIANSGRGRRIHQRTSPGRLRALTALTLLLPGTPMLFQGQEFGASAPFRFFADHKPDLRGSVREGRRAFLAQFPNLASHEMAERLPDPGDPASFQACRLDWSERERNVEFTALHRDLLALRRSLPAFARQARHGLDGAVIAPEAFLLRFFEGVGQDALLLVNLGPDLERASIPDPLVAPPAGCRWRMAWSSEHPDYGGSGTPEVERDYGAWFLPAHAAVVLAARRESAAGRSG